MQSTNSSHFKSATYARVAIESLHILPKSSAWSQGSRTLLTHKKLGLSQTEEHSVLNKGV